jgi:acyl-CoA thioesterase-1
MKKILFVLLLPGLLLSGCSKTVSCLDQPSPEIAAADESSYLEGICRDLTQEWPNNRTITIVCHGHSVPAGYFNTPTVKPFDSYPLLLHRALKKRYPNAVINVIVSAIGGENSIAGAKRFKADVLNHRPDVVLIDYALNDRSAGLNESARAWSAMIEAALAENIKVLLLTPTPDMHHVPDDTTEDLNLHANQIRSLAAKYHVGLVDSLAAFDLELKKGTRMSDLLSNGYNHPNRKGHKIVVQNILEWF